MTKTQEALLNEIRETLQRYKREFVERNLSDDCNYWWVVLMKNNQVQIRANTKSLQALEREGYIKMINQQKTCFGYNLDVVEVL